MPDASGYSYEWDGSAWHRAPDAGSAPGTCYMDHGNDRLITVSESGWGVGQVFSFRQRVGHDWQAMPVPGGPQDRWGMGISYDEQRGELVVFGGFNAIPLTGTWTFDGSSWTQHSPLVTPTARYLPSMCYDSTRQRTVLFGGIGAAVLNDTWEWDGSNWTAVTTATTPTAEIFGSMQFDSARNVAMLVGRSASGPQTSMELWEYDGNNWLQRAAPPLPAGSSPGPLVFDEARAEALLIGSNDNLGRSGAVFAWNGTQWSPRAALGDMPYLGYGSRATADHTGSLVLRFGGAFNGQTSFGQALVSWDGSNWQTLSTGGPPPRSDLAMWSMSTATYVFGGQDPTGAMLSDTWRWNGVSWTQLATAAGPSARMESAIAFHATQNHALLFGGTDTAPPYGALGGTWRFDGTNWQQLTNGPQPGARRQHAMAYDPIRDRIVLYGGQNLSPFAGGSTVYNDTWEHDGTSWTQVLTGIAPAPSSTCTMAFDWARQAIVSVETYVDGYRLWEYDGLAWTPLPVAGEFGSDHPLTAYSPVATTGPNGRLAVSEYLSMLELLPSPSSAQAYGTACTAAAPHLTASDLPDLDQANFALEVAMAPANSPVAIIGANQDVNVPVLGCTLLVLPGVASTLLAADGLGYARWALPLPNVPALLGNNFYFQTAALDATAPSGITLSRGLRITLGQ
tara:strand:+ start:351 stop:2387 length:2037 start_codon:yes stop_codon:yes gene_type:complete